MKTKQEIRKADKRELEIIAERAAIDKAAHQEFKEATNDEHALLQSALARWKTFYEPLWEAYRAKLTAAGKAEIEALAKVRGDWKACLTCGILASRYQKYCTDVTCPYVFPLDTLAAKKPSVLFSRDF